MKKIIFSIGGESNYLKTKKLFLKDNKNVGTCLPQFSVETCFTFARQNISRLCIDSSRFALFERKNAPKSSETIIAASNISFWLCSDYDRSDDAPTSKNPMAAAGAVKDALATGGVDKVFVQKVTSLFGLICVLESRCILLCTI